MSEAMESAAIIMYSGFPRSSHASRLTLYGSEWSQVD